MLEVIRGIYFGIISSLIGGVIIAYVIVYLSRNVKPILTKNVYIYTYYNHKHPFRSFIFLIILICLINLFISGVLGFLVLWIYPNLTGFPRMNTIEVLNHALHSGVYGMVWVFINFIVWGILAVLVYMMGCRKSIFRFDIFVSAGFLAGITICPAAAISWWISERLLDLYTMKDVYDLNLIALIRLNVPALLCPIGYGILASYSILNVSNKSFLRTLYTLRLRILLLFVIFSVSVIGLFCCFGQGNFIWQTMLYYNVPQVWLSFCIIFVCCFHFGTILYENYIRNKWFREFSVK